MQQIRRQSLVFTLLGLALAASLAFGQAAPKAGTQFEQPLPVLADPGGQGGGAG